MLRIERSLESNALALIAWVGGRSRISGRSLQRKHGFRQKMCLSLSTSRCLLHNTAVVKYMKSYSRTIQQKIVSRIIEVTRPLKT